MTILVIGPGMAGEPDMVWAFCVLNLELSPGMILVQ
jgi:hypothetical protein